MNETGGMDKMIELVRAMGFWGWMALIAITAIVAEAVVTIKKMQMKHGERPTEGAPGHDLDSDT